MKDMSFIKKASRSWVKELELLETGNPGILRANLALLFKELDKTSREERTVQFESCFGHTANSKVPVYELEYGEEHSRREPQELGDITAFYRAFGLRISEQARERADHASVECEFMYFLLYKEAYALATEGEEKASICRAASREFLSKHVGRWMPSLARRVLRFSKGGLLMRIADFTLAFIAEDCRLQNVNAAGAELPVRAVRENEETGCVSCLLSSSVLDSGGEKP